MDNDIETLLTDFGLVEQGHFVYTSSLHGGSYVNSKALYKRPALARRCAQALVDLVPPEVEVIVGAERGGIGLALMLADAIGERTGRAVMAAWAVKTAGGFAIDEPYAADLRAKHVAMVDDVVTTTKTCSAMAEAVLRAHGRPRTVVAVWNRSQERITRLFDIPIAALVEREFETFPDGPEHCPLCRDRVPMRTDLGHGKEWLQKHGDFPTAGGSIRPPPPG